MPCHRSDDDRRVQGRRRAHPPPRRRRFFAGRQSACVGRWASLVHARAAGGARTRARASRSPRRRHLLLPPRHAGGRSPELAARPHVRRRCPSPAPSPSPTPSLPPSSQLRLHLAHFVSVVSEQYVQVRTSFASLERLLQYLQLPREKARRASGDPPPPWPRRTDPVLRRLPPLPPGLHALNTFRRWCPRGEGRRRRPHRRRQLIISRSSVGGADGGDRGRRRRRLRPRPRLARGDHGHPAGPRPPRGLGPREPRPWTTAELGAALRRGCRGDAVRGGRRERLQPVVGRAAAPLLRARAAAGDANPHPRRGDVNLDSATDDAVGAAARVRRADDHHRRHASAPSSTTTPSS